MRQQQYLTISLLSTSVLCITVLPANAAYLRSLDAVYKFYENQGYQFSTAEETIISDAFNSVQPFMGENGKQNAIAAGFAPFLYELKGHGEHWFNPVAVNLEADPSMPTGLNFDQNGELVAAFWTDPRYSYEGLFDWINRIPQLDGQHEIVQAYQEYKATEALPEPSAFEPFGNLAPWHSHLNTVFNNLGARDPNTGEFDVDAIEFTQSMSDANWVNALLNGLNDDNIVVAPYEQDPSLGYPPFNSLIMPGFYMIHMWLGLGNELGLFANTHPDVSPNATEEHLTFEDGSDGHDHSPPTPPSNEPQSIPESSTLIGLFGLGILGLKSAIKRHFNAQSK